MGIIHGYYPALRLLALFPLGDVVGTVNLGWVHPSYVCGRLAPTEFPLKSPGLQPTYDPWDEPPSTNQLIIYLFAVYLRLAMNSLKWSPMTWMMGPHPYFRNPHFQKEQQAWHLLVPEVSYKFFLFGKAINHRVIRMVGDGRC